MKGRDHRSPSARRLADLRGASLAFALEVVIVASLVAVAILFAYLALTVF